MNGSTSFFNTPAWIWSLFFWIGVSKDFLNCASLPKYPGFRKLKIDQRSNSRFSTGVPVRARRCLAWSLRIALVCAALGFLIFCASSITMRCQFIAPNRASSLRINVKEVIIKSWVWQISWKAAVSWWRSLPWCTIAFKCGANFSISFCQLPTTEVGAINNVGGISFTDANAGSAFLDFVVFFPLVASRTSPIAALSFTKRAIICTGFPKPMSSARQPFKPRLSRYCSHATPRFWYSRRVPLSWGGFSIGSNCCLSCNFKSISAKVLPRSTS